ncbi:uncharacterized protein V2V93DRAFT_373444 [Kockiozyma suomiensis]|uniref:uncharacterized protein n=1 Tax=Kockiozyma suomiensis TaxID=1337062 RepID=UPI003342E7AD
MARRSGQGTFNALVVVMLLSLFILYRVALPGRLEPYIVTLPDLRRHLSFQLPSHLSSLQPVLDTSRLETGDSHGRIRSARFRQLAEASAKINQLGLHKEITAFMFSCVSGIPPKAEVFDSFVSLKYGLMDVRIANEQWPMTYNPTIFALPPSSHFPFLIVARVRGEGFFQTSLICEGKYIDETKDNSYGFPITTRLIGCATSAKELAVPQTPARDCQKRDFMSDVPGFHDPRIFWSNEGAPLMIINQQSRYGCFGLWVIDLRSVYPSLRYRVNRALLNEYPTVMELTRLEGRGNVEKNYLLFYDSVTSEPYVQYDLAHNKRHFAKLIGNGLTTSNLTSPLELSCIHDDATWHQATNAIKIVLCNYGECTPGPENTVYMSFLHKKSGVKESLKVQYRRYVAVWKTTAPFELVGFGNKHIRFDNEDEWEQKFDVEGKFLYTVSINWETNQNRYEGYLNENVLVSLGVGDHGNAAVVLPARDLLTCMDSCSASA